MKNNKHVLAIMAHPDDIEFQCAGTLVLLRQKGYKIHLTSMTPGDCGSADRTSEEISRIRVRENTRSAAVIGATYDCMGCRDLFVCYDRPTIQRVVELIRKYDPFLVITHSPQCYMIDHEATASVVRNACFGAGMPNLHTEAEDPSVPSSGVPHLYYCDAVDHKNQFGERIIAQFYIDITRAMPTKEKMLKCHASQREWLLKHHHMDEYVRKMKSLSAERGKEVGVLYAECYRQHLGHGYPQDNALGKILGCLTAR